MSAPLVLRCSLERGRRITLPARHDWPRALELVGVASGVLELTSRPGACATGRAVEVDDQRRFTIPDGRHLQDWGAEPDEVVSGLAWLDADGCDLLLLTGAFLTAVLAREPLPPWWWAVDRWQSRWLDLPDPHPYPARKDHHVPVP